MAELRACGDCAAKPGEPHSDGCDVARCLATGIQRLQCDGSPRAHADAGCFEARDCGHQVWTGAWPGVAECEEYGWQAEETEATKAHFRKMGWPVPDKPHHDLNRLNSFSGETGWDPVACRYRRRSDPVDDMFYVHWHLDRGLFLEPSARYTIEGVTLPAAEVIARIAGEAGR
jgi:hypothetical protein